MDNNKWRGAITVYLCIILSAVIMLSGLMIDIVRIKSAKVQLERALNTAAISALAGYDSELKENYGLFALHSSESETLTSIIENYLSKSLTVDIEANKDNQEYNYLKSIILEDQYQMVDFIDIFDYKIESIEVTPIFNFTENEITKQQILEYMKYRAPAQFAESFIEKVNDAASTGNLGNAYKQKTVIEKKLSKIDKHLVKLQKYIDALNTFDKSMFQRTDSSGSTQLIHLTVQEQAYQFYKQLDNMSQSNAYIEDEIEGLQRQSAEAAKEISRNISEHILYCIEAAKNAQIELSNIEHQYKSVQKDIESLKAYLKEIEKNKAASGLKQNEILSSFQKDMEKYEKLLSNENSKSISSQLSSNYNSLLGIQPQVQNFAEDAKQAANALLPMLEQKLENSKDEKGSLEITEAHEYLSLVKRLMESTNAKAIEKNAKSIQVLPKIINKSTGKKGKDPRKATADTVKKLKTESEVFSKHDKEIENPSLLPSYFSGGIYPNKIFSEQMLNSSESTEDETPQENMDVDFGEDSSFTEDTFSFISSFANRLKQGAEDLRNNLYINEYILGIFKDAVEIEESNTDGKISNSFFHNGEVEYILHGNRNETVNKYLVKSEIFLIRLGMNTLHIYSDSTKRLQALELATGLAGFTGFGIPIVHNLLMCAWGGAEAFYDVQELYQGKKVPFIKDLNNWRTDLTPDGITAKENENIQSNVMDFDYHDYLRLLLLVEDGEVKMNRLEDLIELNMQKNNPTFKLNSCNTYMKINVKVSVKYWFITNLFVPSDKKTADGRHIIHLELWRGY